MITATRHLLVDALAAGVTGATVYRDPPAQVTPPAVIVAPDDPYLEPRGIGAGGTVQLNYRLLCAVSTRDTPGSLEALEGLLYQVWVALPDGCEPSPVAQPSLEEVGPSELLVATVDVSLVATS